MQSRNTRVFVAVAAAVLVLSLAVFLRFGGKHDDNHVPSTAMRSVRFLPSPNPESRHNPSADKVVTADPPEEHISLTPEMLQKIVQTVQGLDLARAQHVGTWELGGISQMMLLLKTPDKAELNQLAANIAGSLAIRPDDPRLKLIAAEAHKQLRAFMDSPFPLQLITFNAPIAEDESVTFDIAYIAREEHLTLDPDGGPPTFIISGGVAGSMTDEGSKARYGHLFQLE